MSAKKTVRELIISGRLETAVRELLHQVDHEADLLAHPDHDLLHDRAVHILSRLNEQEHQEGLGIDDDKERNRIRLSLIDLDRDVASARRGERIQSEVPNLKGAAAAPKRSNNTPLILGILGGLAVVIAAFFMLNRTKTEDPVTPTPRRPQVEQVDNGNADTNDDQSGQGGGTDSPETDEEGKIRMLPIFPERSATGSMVSNGDGPRFPLRFGDTEQNKEIRAYLSFPLDRIPAGVDIVSAMLYVNRGGGDYRELRRAIVEEVNIGDGLDQEDFDANRSPLAVLRSDSLMSQQQFELDVTDKFELVTLYNRPFFTLQFRPDEIFRNRKADQYEIRTGQNRTRLEVKFKLD
ncbi:MAG: hypothetical protein AAGF87_02425 [Bacteroidota bacterium]